MRNQTMQRAARDPETNPKSGSDRVEMWDGAGRGGVGRDGTGWDGAGRDGGAGRGGARDLVGRDITGRGGSVWRGEGGRKGGVG